MTQTQPKFNDINDIIGQLPDMPQFQSSKVEPMTWLNEWLGHFSRTLDLSRGFMVNRCALYWAGYDMADGFDGQAFVDSCQDSKGALRELAQILDTDLQIFELDPQTHMANRSSDELALATSYGMMAIEEGTQIFCACSFGQGVEAVAETAIAALASETNQKDDHFLETFMTKHCGLDHAAMMGAAIASIMKGIPMIAEGKSGQLIKALLESATGKSFDNIILTNDLSLPINHALPGQKMILTAIMLKSLYTALDKTDCGKVKQAA